MERINGYDAWKEYSGWDDILEPDAEHFEDWTCIKCKDFMVLEELKDGNYECEHDGEEWRVWHKEC